MESPNVNRRWGGGGAGRMYREKWGKVLMKRKGEVQSIHAGHEREREK